MAVFSIRFIFPEEQLALYSKKREMSASLPFFVVESINKKT